MMSSNHLMRIMQIQVMLLVIVIEQGLILHGALDEVSGARGFQS